MNLTDDTETILANKLMELIKCLVELYLPGSERDSAVEPIEEITLAFRSMPSPELIILHDFSSDVPPSEDDCSVKIEISKSNTDHVIVNGWDVEAPAEEQFILSVNTSEPPGTVEWFYSGPFEAKQPLLAVNGQDLRTSVSPDGLYASIALTQKTLDDLATGLAGNPSRGTFQGFVAVDFTSQDGSKMCKDLLTIYWRLGGK